jgi:integrase
VTKRHDNRGLRKVCDCPRRRWLKCLHPWHVNVAVPGGLHLRKSVDKIAGKPVAKKEDAQALLEKLRTDLREGKQVLVKRNGRVDLAAPTAPVRDMLTLAQLLDDYIARHVTIAPRGDNSIANAECHRRVITRTEVELPTGERRAFGEWLVRDITPDAIDKFKAARTAPAKVAAKDADGRQRARVVGGLVGANRNLSFLRAAFNWGLKKRILDFLAESPFRYKGQVAVSLHREADRRRRRRLEGDEAERLLAACDPPRRNPKTKEVMKEQPLARLRPIVEAAIETGCRRGELLSLQWSQVKGLDGERPYIYLPAGKTKTKTDRVVPVSSRLKAILEMRRQDPAGEDFPPTAYVFGNAIGQRTKSITTAWKLACRRAGLIDFHFHDLRREAGSRWIEGGMVLHEVRDFLGHARVSQTDTYLGTNADRLHEALKRFERHQSGEAAAGAARNAVAIEVAAAASETGGQSTEPKDDREDRSEKSRSVVN